jgi:hypothetical protein
MAYGEDTYLQVKMEQQGYVIGFDPDLRIKHAVEKNRLTPKWFLKSEYTRGACSWQTYDRTISWPMVLRKAAAGMVNLAKNTVIFLPRIIRKDYCAENLIVDVLSPFAFAIGQFSEGLKNLSRIDTE